MRRSQKLKDMVVNLCYSKVFGVILCVLGIIFGVVCMFHLYNYYLVDRYKLIVSFSLCIIIVELMNVVDAVRGNNRQILRKNRLVNIVLKDFCVVYSPLFLVMLKLAGEIIKLICICTNFEYCCICLIFPIFIILLVIAYKVTIKINNYFSEKIIRDNIIRLY